MATRSTVSVTEQQVLMIQDIHERDDQENWKIGDTFKYIHNLEKRLEQCKSMTSMQISCLCELKRELPDNCMFFIGHVAKLSLQLWDVKARGKKWSQDLAPQYEKSHTYYEQLYGTSEHTKKSLIAEFRDDARLINNPDEPANNYKKGFLVVLVYKLQDITLQCKELMLFDDYTQERNGEVLNFLLGEMIRKCEKTRQMAQQAYQIHNLDITDKLQDVFNPPRLVENGLFYIGFTKQRSTGIAEYLWTTKPKGQFWKQIEAAYTKRRTYYAHNDHPKSTYRERDLIDWARANGHGNKLLNGPRTRGNMEGRGIIYVLLYTPKKIPKDVKDLWNGEYTPPIRMDVEGELKIGVCNPPELRDFLRDESVAFIDRKAQAPRAKGNTKNSTATDSYD